MTLKLSLSFLARATVGTSLYVSLCQPVSQLVIIIIIIIIIIGLFLSGEPTKHFDNSNLVDY